MSKKIEVEGFKCFHDTAVFLFNNNFNSFIVPILQKKNSRIQFI